MAYTTINDPTQYFETTTYTGNASTLAITSLNFQPDFLWIKRRSSTSTHALFNSNVGRDKSLGSESADAEYTSPSDKDLISFDSNGFTVAQPSQRNVNGSGQTFVGWSWKANGGTTTSVSASGSGASQIIASTHQANTTAGFSIVTFTAPSVGTGNDYTVSHGLGAVPEVIILKRRDGSGNWHVYHKGTGALGATFLNLTNAFFDAEYFGDTTPTSTVFSQSEGSASDPGHTQVAYCFTPIKGFSKFGTYTGNGSSDGTFVYTGFKPAWIMVKGATTAQVWSMRDNKRDSYNSAQKAIYANLSDAESNNANNSIDLLSNGFKIRNLFGTENSSGDTYIYMAFAESPFVSSDGVPTTAR